MAKYYRFGAMVRNQRIKAHLTQVELAAQVDIDSTYLSKIESGVLPPPSGKVISRLAEVLNIDRDELIVLGGKIPPDIAQALKERAKSEFGAKLKALRIKTGMTQSELATKVNINFTYLSKIESGVLPPPSKKVILRLSEALSIDKDELVVLAGRVPSSVIEKLKVGEGLQTLRAKYSLEKEGIVSNKSGGSSIMQSLKRFSHSFIPVRGTPIKIAIPIICAIVIAISLWFAPIAQALTITITNGSSGTLGSSYSFTVQVDVENTDLLPIQSVDLQIYNVATPSYVASLTDLPMAGGYGGSASKNYSGSSGTATVSSTTAYGWGGATDTRYGYGYGYSSGTYATIALGTNFGYGYGYGTHIGATSVTFSVTWTPPSSWPTGTYKIQTIVFGTSGDTSKAFSNTPLATFTLSAASSDGSNIVGGGGGTPPASYVVSPGVTNISRAVDPLTKAFTAAITASSSDSKVNVNIASGVVGKTSTGAAISTISIQPMTAPPSPVPTGNNIVGIPYDLGPSGATFNPPITVSFKYTLPAGADPKNLTIMYYDSVKGWTALDNIKVDAATGTISGTTSHFTAFSVVLAPATTPTPTTTTTPAPTTTTPKPTTTTPAPTTTTLVPTTTTPVPTTTTTPKPTTTTPAPTPTPVSHGLAWYWILIIVVVAVLIILVVVMVIRRRRD